MGYRTRNQFARVVKAEMASKSISLRRLAAESDITPGYLSLVLTGERNPPQPEKIDKMTRALGLRPPMLHLLAGYIPQHDRRWRDFFDRLRFMSDDEIDEVMEFIHSFPKRRRR